MDIGLGEWLIILAVVLLLFGAGRLSRIGGELGAAIREFRNGLQGERGGETSNVRAGEKPRQPPE